jgi:hypothetical protein
MYIVIEHDIHDAKTFQACAERAFPPPQGLHVHQFLPANDLSRAVCVYEADSLDEVRNYIDGLLGDCSTQRYYPVAESNAMGLPQKEAA